MEEDTFYDYATKGTKKDIKYQIQLFNIEINELLLNIKEITKVLKIQLISSNQLIKEIMLENKYSKKIIQLYDRIGMLQNSRKLLEDNIKSINYNIKYFSSEIEKILVFDNKSNINNINIKEINNNFMYDSSFNNNYNNNIDFGINQFRTINYNINQRKKKVPKIKNKSQSSIKLESNYEKYLNSQKMNKNNMSKFKQISLDEKRYENNIFDKDIFNIQLKKSRNCIKKQNYYDSTNLESTFGTLSYKNNNSKKKIINNNTTSKNKNNNKRINGNYSLNLAQNVIKFIFLIKEMKTKYNKKDSIYDAEFKKTKSAYDKLKIYIEIQAKKIINMFKNKTKDNSNGRPKEQMKIENNNVNSQKNIVLKNIFNNLIIEKNTHFYYINIPKKEEKLNIIIKKEISFYIINKINKINTFNKDYSEIHEKQLAIINQIFNINDKNTIKELQEKIEALKEELKKYKEGGDVENSLDESKVDKEQLEFLLNENQELKNQIEELKENNNISNSKDDIEKYYKDIINENETKIKFLTEKNKFYENEIKKYKENNSKENNDIVDLKVENSNIKKELENIKKENQFLTQKIKESNIKNNFDEIIPDKYDIICDKNYEKLSWILLREKIGKENDYESYIWLEKNLVNNLDKFNYLNEEDSIKIQIMNYIKQLEEKDYDIYKLKQRLNKYEKVDI